jgi:pimeloyl-ACP methyl ester carboxylesterase
MGLGRYAASEKDVYTASVGAYPGGVRGVIYCHGRNDDATAPRHYASIGELRLVNAVAEVFPVLSIDAGGVLTYGNSTAVARVADAVTYLQGTLGAKAGTVLLIGASMGCLTALNYAKANPSKVGAIVTVNSAVDLNDIVTNNRGGLAAEVNTAYGGTYVEATNGPTSNPANYAASLSVPIRLHYATDDTLAIPSTVTTFAATAQNATAVSVGALGHTQAAIDAAPRDQILAFLRQYA